jgi:hypothetical protein
MNGFIAARESAARLNVGLHGPVGSGMIRVYLAPKKLF